MPRLVALANAVAEPWKNGAGTTRELLKWPADGGWRVRVSVAEIDREAPFSTFAGVQRWFAVIGGDGVDLVVDGARQRCTVGSEPVGFKGGAEASASPVGGATRDLNLMLRSEGEGEGEGAGAGAMLLAKDSIGWAPSAAQCGLFTAVAGSCQAGGLAHDVPAEALLWFDAAPAHATFFVAAPSAPGATVGWWLAASPAPNVAIA